MELKKIMIMIMHAKRILMYAKKKFKTAGHF